MNIDSNPEDGFSLLAIVVGLGLSSVLLLGVMHATAVTVQSTSKAQLDTEKIGLAQDLGRRVDCQRTLLGDGAPVAAGCHGKLVTMRDKSGKTVVSASSEDPTRIGRWTLRARCFESDGTIGVDIQVARPHANARNVLAATDPVSFHNDPLHRATPLSWTRRGAEGFASGASLFPKGRLLCRDELMPRDADAGAETRGFFLRWIRQDAAFATIQTNCVTKNVSNAALGCACAVGWNAVTLNRLDSRNCALYNNGPTGGVSGPEEGTWCSAVLSTCVKKP